MIREINDIVLEGCAPVPLAHYLKALGILRLVSENDEADPEARGYWKNDAFMLRTKMSVDELVDFFLNDYRPTPIVAPWNGGSGFSPKDNQVAINKIQASSSDRFCSYKTTIAISDAMRESIGITEKVSSENKEKLLQACRGSLPDDAINWLDAAYVLTDSGPKYPPLLGTGGNDGRLDFTNNFMQRLSDVIQISNGKPKDCSSKYLENALFAHQVSNLLTKVAIGQFYPTAAGGANASIGFSSDSIVNPWDYILMLEGALLFASSCIKKLENNTAGAMSAPFSVRQVGAGYGSAAQEDSNSSSSRAEIWVPVWDKPTRFLEMKSLMSEGRANVKRRPARNGVDFARAIAGLGVDRGIGSFQRYGFMVRNGLAYFATPLDRFQVNRQPQVDLLHEIDDWLNNFKRQATSDKAPASAGRALRNLETSILSLCKGKGPSRVQEVLISLGNCEKAMTTSEKWTRNVAYLKPIPPLSPKWLKEADDGSPEFRLAASLASVYGKYKNQEGRTIFVSVRSQLEPVASSVKEGKTSKIWWVKEADRDLVWSEGNPIKALNAVMSRRIMKAQQSGATTYPDHGNLWADLGDISDFIEGRIDIQRMSDLLWGLILIDWPAVIGRPIGKRISSEGLFPGATYALLKLCFAGGKVADIEISLFPQIHRRAVNGDSVQATELASRRLRGSGLVPAINVNTSSNEMIQRIAAALIFPINDYQRQQLVDAVCRPQRNLVDKTE